MGASECSPKVAVLPATPHQVFTHARTPPQWWSHHRFTQAVYSLTLVLCVIIHVWCLCSCGCHCLWHCFALALALSLSLPPPVFLRHTHAGDLIHRVYDHLASPRHRGCVAMNTMRVGVTIPTGWPPCSFGSLQDVRRRSTMKELGGGGGVGLTYMRIYRVGQRGGSLCLCVCVESCGRSEKRVDDGCE